VDQFAEPWMDQVERENEPPAADILVPDHQFSRR
jgi:hypothetical protein